MWIALGRRVPHRGVHRAGDVPHVLRRAPRRGGRRHASTRASTSATSCRRTTCATTSSRRASSHGATTTPARRRRSTPVTHGDHAHGAHVAPHESPKLILDPDLHPRRSRRRRRVRPTPAPFGEEWEQLQRVRRAARRGRSTAAPARRRRPSWTAASDEAAAAADGRGGRTPPGCGYDGAGGGHGLLLPGRSATPSSQWSEGRCCRSPSSPPASVSSWVVCVALYTPARPPPRRAHRARRAAALAATPSSPTSTTSTTSTRSVIVHAIAHPIASAAYWINQNVIDGIVNGVGRAGERVGAWSYRNIDQRVVDGAVNGSGAVADGDRRGAAAVQSGKVNQYGALLFGAAAVGAIVLVIVNV